MAKHFKEKKHCNLCEEENHVFHSSFQSFANRARQQRKGENKEPKEREQEAPAGVAAEPEKQVEESEGHVWEWVNSEITELTS